MRALLGMFYRRRPAALVAAAVLSGVLGQSSGASAQQVQDDHDPSQPRRSWWTHSTLLAGRINPLGLFLEERGSYRHKLGSSYQTPWREAYVGFTLNSGFSPSYGRVGGSVDFSPAAFLQLGAFYDFIGYFNPIRGLTYTLQNYYSRADDWSDRSQRPASGGAPGYSTFGHLFGFTANLQALLGGSLLLRSNFRAAYHDIQTLARPGSGLPPPPLYYDIVYDIQTPAHGWLLTNDLDAWYMGENIIFGVRYTLTHAVMPAGISTTASCPGGSSNCGPSADTVARAATTHRIGPVIGYRFFERNHARFNNPMLLLIVNWWAQHRFRGPNPDPYDARDYVDSDGNMTRNTVNSAVPYVAIAFRFSGEIL